MGIMTDTEWDSLKTYGIIGAAVGMNMKFNRQWEKACEHILGNGRYLENRKRAVDRFISRICRNIIDQYFLDIEVYEPARELMNELLAWAKKIGQDNPQYELYIDAQKKIYEAVEERREANT